MEGRRWNMFMEMKGIVMDFGPVRAVDQVDLTIEPGSIVGLLGENGAGKSTLMNILAGTFQPVKGSIFINGEKVTISSARAANQYGIRFIHQELNLCNDLTVFENMFLAEEISTKLGTLNKKEMIHRCEEVFKRMKVSINAQTLVNNLQAAQKQLVEIGKALLFQSELIIMDEPTTALSTNEVKNLFEIIRQLKKEKVSFIYISHKMPELFEICESFYVLRDGKLVSKGRFEDVNENSITEMMIGRQLADDDFSNHVNHTKEEVILSVKNLCGADFRDISFDLHKGEVLAITGLQGSGRDTLADTLFGVEPYTGRVEIKGTPVKARASVRTFMKKGIALVPRMRKERGIHNDLSIYDNVFMGYLNTRFKHLIIRNKNRQDCYLRQKQALNIKSEHPNNPITSLSGGNQQKVILGKWLEADADILLFDNPTQGIDVGTKFEIYHLILKLAGQNKAVIVFTAEFPEIYKVADSCLVLYKGEINAILNRSELTEKNIMYYSTGANMEVEKNA
jgi:ribose transport system ATP-binding protein